MPAATSPSVSLVRAAPARTVKRGPSAAEKQLEKLQARHKTARAKAKADQDETQQMVIAVAMAFALGYAAQKGWLAKIPTLGGLPVLVTTGAVGLIGGQYVSGIAGDVLQGVGVASLLAAAYQMGSTGTVSGDAPEGTNSSEVRRAVDRLKQELGVAGDDDVEIRPTGRYVEG